MSKPVPGQPGFSYLEVGDTVVLNSGGPDMLVVALEDKPSRAVCEWDYYGETKRKLFLAKCLSVREECDDDDDES